MLDDLLNIEKTPEEQENFQEELKKYINQYNEIIGNEPKKDYLEQYTQLSIKDLEYLLKLKNKQKQNLITNKLVKAFRKLGVEKILTKDGQEVEIDFFISVITNNKNEKANWIKKIGRDDLIRTTLNFAPGDFTKELQDYLSEKASFKVTTDVNTNSMKSLLKKRMNDKNIPDIEKFPPRSACDVKIFDIVKIKNIK